MRDAIKRLKEGTVIPAMPLVLDENRRFDEAGQRKLIRYYCAAGAGGIAVAVHTTQFEIRLPKYDLFGRVLEVCADEIDRFERKAGKTIIKISGVCGVKEQSLRETETAAALGYDAVLLSPGGLSAMSEDELAERTQSVAELLPVIGFYLQPSVGGRVFSYGYWEKICRIKNLAAIKIAPFNRYQTLDVVRAAAYSENEIALYTGNDDNIIIDLITEYKFENGKTMRFAGGLLGHWSVWTNTVVKLFEKIKTEGLKPEILQLANEVTDCNAAFFDTAHNYAGCIAGLHEVLRRQGLMKGIWCLNPEEGLSEGQLSEIDRVYKAYPHLNDDTFVTSFLCND